ncbi:MAG TPA: RecQ family ATP-dependent DNA helicase, partial [Candidatus Avibacteroides excrementipullorum]|nr:RecQ family ATP-dependent DNA helicase [Candidatus Avibacteroides excrementipullorum]
MSIWGKFFGTEKVENKNKIIGNKTNSVPCSAPHYAIVDIEVGLKDHKIHDIGALKHDDTTFHKTSKEELFIFLNDVDYICGHNIIHHDANYLFTDQKCRWTLVDTLYVSPLLFPERPYHRLVKDDKLISEQMNNPVNDCKKAKDLLQDEIACWHSLPKEKRLLFASLLKDKKEFEGFLSMVSAAYIHGGIPGLIKDFYAGKI